jgi:hypothetical protein
VPHAVQGFQALAAESPAQWPLLLLARLAQKRLNAQPAPLVPAIQTPENQVVRLDQMQERRAALQIAQTPHGAGRLIDKGQIRRAIRERLGAPH